MNTDSRHSNGNGPDVFFLMSSLARAVNHQLRTPLSIISNNLFCLRGSAPAPELVASEEGCARIAAILTEMNRLGNEPLNLELFDLAPIISDLTGTPCREAYFRGDMRRIRLAFQLLGELPPPLDGNVRWRVVASKDFLVLRATHPIEETHGRQCTSFTAFYRDCFDSDAIAPIVLDAILFSHKIEVTIDTAPALETSVRFILEARG